MRQGRNGLQLMVTATTWSHPQKIGTPSAGKAIIKRPFLSFSTADCSLLVFCGKVAEFKDELVK